MHVSAAAWAQAGLPDSLGVAKTLCIKGKAEPIATFSLPKGAAATAEAVRLLEARHAEAVRDALTGCDPGEGAGSE